MDTTVTQENDHDQEHDLSSVTQMWFPVEQSRGPMVVWSKSCTVYPAINKKSGDFL